MDKFHLIRLLRCAYPDRLLGNTGSTDDAGGIVFLNAESENEEHVDDSFAMRSRKAVTAYANTEYGSWLLECEHYIWNTMLNEGEDYWAVHVFGTHARVWVFVDLLVTLAHFIDDRVSKLSPFVPILQRLDILSLFHECIQCSKPTEFQYLEDRGLATKYATIITSGRYVMKGYMKWALLGIETLAGAHKTVTDNIGKLGWDLVPLDVPRKLPDQSVLGLLPMSVRSDKSFHITLGEFGADFINSGPFKIAITRYLDKHLELDNITGEVLVFWDGSNFPGEKFLVFKGNRMAK
jgi:hypothetical protein